ncbi:MAG: hypothetical protein OHK0022_12950 [Roseiflexaceae bacterium]
MRFRTCALISALSLLTLIVLPFPAPVSLADLLAALVRGLGGG